MKKTEEQEEICRSVRETKDHIMIDALAGTGKTSTLVMASEGVKGFALALAFNKKIAEELEKRMPSNFECKTMNSLGFAAMRKALANVKSWRIEEKKTSNVLDELMKGKPRLKGEKWSGVMRLVRQAQLSGLGEGEGRLMEDTEGSWNGLADRELLDSEEQEEIIELARKTLARNNELTLTGLASFDDQLYWPIVNGAKFEKYGTVFGDEGQDWNDLQHEMTKRCVGGRLVVAGDPRQSIYAWRGARVGGMEELEESLTSRDWRRLGLTMTWRCPKEVVKRQLWHVPAYRASETNKEGRIAKLPEGLDEDGIDYWGVKELMELRPSNTATMAILCRNNAPLWKLAFRLLRQRVSIVMQGADLGKILSSLSRKIEPDDTVTTARFLGKLHEWRDKEIAKAKENEYKVEQLYDRVGCLEAVAENTRTTGELREAIERLFARTTGTLTLSTIHRAKGLEWDLVVHLDHWRVPSKRAEAMGGEELEQEHNLLYVAETRTREVLVLASLEDFI